MDFSSKYSIAYFEHLKEDNLGEIRSHFPSLTHNDVKLVLADFLHLCGGTLCHDLLLIMHEITLTLSPSKWREMINLGSNKALAKDTILTFFLFHTSMRDVSFFDGIGIDSELRKRYREDLFTSSYKDYPHFYKTHNKRIYKRLGLSESEMQYINAFKAAS